MVYFLFKKSLKVIPFYLNLNIKGFKSQDIANQSELIDIFQAMDTDGNGYIEYTGIHFLNFYLLSKNSWPQHYKKRNIFSNNIKFF